MVLLLRNKTIFDYIRAESWHCGKIQSDKAMLVNQVWSYSLKLKRILNMLTHFHLERNISHLIS